MRRSKGSKVGAGNLAVPVKTVAPVLSGTAAEGATITCGTGTWSNTPTSYQYTFKDTLNNVLQAASSTATYVPVTADIGKSIICYVRAFNALGSSALEASNTLGPVASAGSGVSLPTPTYSLVTASGASPVTWRAVPASGNVSIGTYCEIEVVFGVLNASDAIFAAGAGGIGSNGVTNFQTYEVIMQGADWEAGSTTIDNFVQPSGAYTTRCRYRTSPFDPSNSSDGLWSNKVYDTITASSAQFAHTTTTDYKNTLTFTNGFKTIQGQFQGAQQSCRATLTGADKGQFEVTINSFDTGSTGLVTMGFENGTIDFSAYNARPGFTNNSGVYMEISKGSGGVTLYWNSTSGTVSYTGPNATAGDTYALIPDRVAGTMKVYHIRSTTVTLLGTATVPGLSGFTKAWAGTRNDEQITGNFGGSTYAAPLGTTGGVIYG